MDQDMDLDKLNILCGLSAETNNSIQDILISAAKIHGYQAICINRYRKPGIAQYITEHPECKVAVIQEAMQSTSPYEAEELAELMDLNHINVIVILNKKHKGKMYMKILYASGILNALYEEDATAQNIVDLILTPRRRDKCRQYYGITSPVDAVEALEIINETRLRNYIDYLESANNQEEIISRYRYITRQLKDIENIVLIQHLPELVREHLKEDATYLYFMEIINPKPSIFRRIFQSKQRSGQREIIPENTGFLSNRSDGNDIGHFDQRLGRQSDDDVSDLFNYLDTENRSVTSGYQRSSEYVNQVTGLKERNYQSMPPQTVSGTRVHRILKSRGFRITVIAILLTSLVLGTAFIFLRVTGKKTVGNKETTAGPKRAGSQSNTESQSGTSTEAAATEVIQTETQPPVPETPVPETAVEQQSQPPKETEPPQPETVAETQPPAPNTEAQEEVPPENAEPTQQTE